MSLSLYRGGRVGFAGGGDVENGRRMRHQKAVVTEKEPLLVLSVVGHDESLLLLQMEGLLRVPRNHYWCCETNTLNLLKETTIDYYWF